MNFRSRIFASGVRVISQDCGCKPELKSAQSEDLWRYMIRNFAARHLGSPDGEGKTYVARDRQEKGKEDRPCGGCVHSARGGHDSAACPSDCQTQTHSQTSTSTFQKPASTTKAFPTDAKERERIKRNADKEKGIERVVKKKPAMKKPAATGALHLLEARL